MREPFFYPGDPDRGVLCLHGFTGSPFEMHFVGRALADDGFTVAGPLLAGHESPETLDATTWHDWAASADQALAALEQRCRTVSVVGLSLGGLLALHLACQRGRSLAAIATLAAPLWLSPVRELGIRVLARLSAVSGRWRALRKRDGGSDLRDPAMRAANPTFPILPLAALRSLVELTAIVRAELGQVHVPTFVAHGRKDHTAPYACARAIAAKVGTRDVVTLSLPRSYHVVTLDVERDLLVAALSRFLSARMRA